MKKAFTILEVIFVLIVIGILATVMIPKMRLDKLREAAIQVVSHIRYTQHLAMMDDKFNVDYKWYEERWQIRFSLGSLGSDDKIAYAVFSDWIGAHSTHPEINELAKDSATGYVITGGVTDAVHYNDDNVFSKANLGVTYGVDNLIFNSSCKYYGSMRIAFDHFGRPIKGNIGSTTVKVYTDSLKLITNTCEITLYSGTESVTIAIEPETGYTHIL